MDRQVIIFLHMDDQSPGYIADFLSARNIPYQIVRSYAGEPIPILDKSMAGLVFMGGAMSVNDDIAWVPEEIRLIRQALEHDVPVLGHCLGGQLISRALGQEVRANPVVEIGWHPCTRAENVSADDWLCDLPSPFTMFHWHNETFDIPNDCERLFSSQFCENQAYAYGDKVLAMQCHVEMTEPLVTDWITHWKHDLLEETPSRQCFDTINSKVKQSIPQLNQVADVLYRRWTDKLEM